MGENLNELEREVEAARAKLAADLSRLTSPATLDGFQSDIKREAFGVRDAMMASAKSTVQSKLHEVIDDIKARAAANPAAALAIGAGIAWRLIHRPPIASALVGAGVWSLLRTPPVQTYGNPNFDYVQHGKERLQEQAGAVAEQVTERALEFAQTAKERATEFAYSATERTADFANTVREQSAELATIARDQAQHWAAEAGTVTQQIASDVRRQAAIAGRQAADQVAETTAQASDQATVTGRQAVEQVKVGDYGRQAGQAPQRFATQAQQTLADTAARDKLLLGAASVAVAAAFGIALQRRAAEGTVAE